MIPLLLFFGGLSAWFAYRRVSLFRFDFFATLVWLFALLVGSLGLLIHEPLRIETIAFVIAAHGLLLVGYALAGPRKPRFRLEGHFTERRMIFAMLTLIFVALATLRSLLASEIPILNATSDLEAARLAHWERGGENVDLFTQTIRIFSYAAIAYVMLTPLFWRAGRNTKKRGGIYINPHLLLAIAAGVMLVDQSLRDGGRSALIYILIGGTAVNLALFRVKWSRLLAGAIAAFALLYLITVPFYLARNSNFSVDPGLFVRHNCQSGKLSPAIARGSDHLQAFAVSTCYVSTPIYALDDFLTDNEGKWEHTLGSYNLGTVLQADFADTRERIALYYKARNLAENPWATSMRDFWIDFGWLAFLIYLPLGLFFGWASKRQTLRTETEVMRLGLIAVCAFMVPFISPLVTRGLIYPILLTVLVDWGLKLLPDQRRLARRVGNPSLSVLQKR